VFYKNTSAGFSSRDRKNSELFEVTVFDHQNPCRIALRRWIRTQSGKGKMTTANINQRESKLHRFIMMANERMVLAKSRSARFKLVKNVWH